MLHLSLRSLFNRRVSAALTVATIALSVWLILGIERLRTEARASFADTVSGIDLIVAARGNNIQILMATVFGVGSTSNALSWETFEALEGLPEVAWAVPLSHGDNHKGFPVIGTTASYFERFRYGGGNGLDFETGHRFEGEDQAVLGADVAQTLGYAPGTVILNAHGAGDVSFQVHDDAPFTVVGILAETGTPVDRMVYVPLEGFDAIHAPMRAGEQPSDPLLPVLEAGKTASVPVADDHGAEREHADGHDYGEIPDHDEARHEATQGDAHGHAERFEPARINAVLLGLRSKSSVLAMQRFISEYANEPLSAVLPATTLLELWSITGVAENTLRVVAIAVVVAGVLGMMSMVFSTLDARRREFAILRSVGAMPRQICALIVLEAFCLVAAGIAVGIAILYSSVWLADPVLMDQFGVRIGFGALTLREWMILILITIFGIMASLIPAYRVYRTTLSDGLSVRL